MSYKGTMRNIDSENARLSWRWKPSRNMPRGETGTNNLGKTGTRVVHYRYRTIQEIGLGGISSREWVKNEPDLV